MVVRELQLTAFRNHQQTHFQFERSPILLWGANGAGKTSVLEALNIIAVTKSFSDVHDAQLIKHGSSRYSIAATIIHDLGSELTVSIEYAAETGKTIFVSTIGSCSAQELIGLVPCVVLTSSQRALFYGEPALRRAFIDRILSQSFPSYRDTLWQHRNALRQRNAILNAGSASHAELAAWTEELIILSAELLWRRREFVTVFNATLSALSKGLGTVPLTLSLRYMCPWLEDDLQPEFWGNDKDAFVASLTRSIERLRAVDYQRMSTQWGPQRDIFTFYSEDVPVYAGCSQGQQKLALYIVKLTEAETLCQMTQRTPIVLLDDVFSDLDRVNVQLLESSMISCAQKWQLFVTAPSPEVLNSPQQFFGLHLDRGRIVDPYTW